MWVTKIKILQIGIFFNYYTIIGWDTLVKLIFKRLNFKTVVILRFFFFYSLLCLDSSTWNNQHGLTLHIELYQYGLTSSLLRSPLHGSSHNIGTDQNMYLHREMKQHLMDFEVFFYCLRVKLSLKLKKGINSKIIKT